MAVTVKNDNEKRYPVSSIHSYQPLSTNAAKLLEKMIENAVDEYQVGKKTHIMTYDEITGSFGLKKTNNREYVRMRIKEVQALDVVHWDFLGEDQSFLEQVKKIASEDIDATLYKRSQSPIVQTDKFQDLNEERLLLESSRMKGTKKYERVLSEILDLLFPLAVGNKKIFEAFDIHKSGISYTINRHLIDLFVDPQTYGILDRTIIYQFRSAYTMNIYRNACLYQYLGATPWLSINKAKMLLGVEKAIDEHGERMTDDEGNEVFLYHTYGSFKQGAINSALKELKNHFEAGRIPFCVELEEDKNFSPGKRVDAIRFTIKSSFDEDSPVIGIPSILDKSDLTITQQQFQEIVDNAVDLGCRRSAAIEVVKHACRIRKATYEELRSTIEYCQTQSDLKSRMGGRIHGGYVRDALINGWSHNKQDNHTKQKSTGKDKEAKASERRSIELFVKQLTSKVGELINSEDDEFLGIVSAITERNSVLKDMNKKGLKDKKLIAWELLKKLNSEQFERFFGMPRQFKHQEVAGYF